jgi:hypothetical protein
MTTCWLEIDTGNNDFAKIEGGDFEILAPGGQVLLNLAGIPTLLTDLNGQQADQASSAARKAMDQLRDNINSIATPMQAQALESLLDYLDAIHDLGIRNPRCVFRCVAGTPL